MTRQISRVGSYAIIPRGRDILLVRKTSGLYKGRWDLPGGKIEFGESADEAILREILEETAHHAKSVELVCTLSHQGSYVVDDAHFDFHHLGIIYNVSRISPAQGTTPEEDMDWAEWGSLQADDLTPFAQYAVEFLRGPK